MPTEMSCPIFSSSDIFFSSASAHLSASALAFRRYGSAVATVAASVTLGRAVAVDAASDFELADTLLLRRGRHARLPARDERSTATSKRPPAGSTRRYDSSNSIPFTDE